MSRSLRRSTYLVVLVAGSVAVMLAGSLARSGGTLHAAGPDWKTDMDAAMKEAAKDKKDLLLDFTGSDWCSWCIRLSKEVFDTEEFRKEAPKSFVLVELDFPRDATKVPEATKKQNQAWSEKLGVQGFPTIFLADAAGLPYAQTGYQPGGAKKYLEHLDQLRGVRVRRDEALAQATKSEGIEKAKSLDAALEAVGEPLASNAYGERIQEIMKLDPDNAAGLRTKYEDKVNVAEVRKMVARIEREFDGSNFEALGKILAEAEEKYGRSSKARIELGQFKVNFLGAQGKDEDAAKLIDSLLAEKGLEPMARLQLSLQKAGVLRKQDKQEEVVKLLDSLIADEALDADVRLQLRNERANTLVALGKVDEALKGIDEALAAQTDPERKVRVLVGKAEILVRAGRKEDAVKAFDAACAATDSEDLRQKIRAYQEQALADGPGLEVEGVEEVEAAPEGAAPEGN